jgi:hypothetical protein
MMMKNWWIAGGLALAVFANFSVANESSEVEITELPTNEHAFVDTVGKLDKAKIIALLGEPARADDVKLKDSGRVVASIWHYHMINTDADGAYYQTTELDFIDDKVNVVVFLNNDGSDQSSGQTYEVPDIPPTL